MRLTTSKTRTEYVNELFNTIKTTFEELVHIRLTLNVKRSLLAAVYRIKAIRIVCKQRISFRNVDKEQGQTRT